MTTSSSPLPDPAEGELKEQPPSDLSEYNWDDTDTQRHEPASGGDSGSDPVGPRSGEPLRSAADDPGRFRELLIETGLVSERDLLVIRRKLFPDGSPEEIRPLSKELIRQGLITPYQAAAVRQGKTRGLVIGNYHVLDKIGSGGMGLVLKARDRRQQRIVALKLLPPSISRDRAAVIRFRRETAAVAKLRHPNIVAALDAGETHGLLYLVMELVEGNDLARIVKRQGPLPLDRAIDCMLQAARGLREAHRHGIIHRDIKPANLLLDHSGTVKILDLGLARVSQGQDVLTADSSELNLTVSGAIVGTVDYMSPEQAFDPRLADARSDTYSLGCTFHYMLTGKAPYGGQSFMERLLGHRERPIPSLRSIRGDVPEAVDELFGRMLSKSPESRPQTMEDLLEEIRESRRRAPRARKTPRSEPEAAIDWRADGDDSDSIYDIVSSSPAAQPFLSADPSTVFVRSRSPSSDRIEGSHSRRALRRRRLIVALLFFAIIAAGWVIGVRRGWLRLR